EPGEDQMGIPPIAVRSPKPRARLELTTPSPAEPRWRQPPPRSPPKNQSADAANFSVVRDRPALMAAEARKMRPSWVIGCEAGNGPATDPSISTRSGLNQIGQRWGNAPPTTFPLRPLEAS